MAADETPDPVHMIAKNGELFAQIDGHLVPLISNREAFAAHCAIAKAKGYARDATSKRLDARKAAAPAPAAPDAKTLARRRVINECLKEMAEAKERFAAQKSLQQQFDVPFGERPGDPGYERGLDRFLNQLAAHP